MQNKTAKWRRCRVHPDAPFPSHAPTYRPRELRGGLLPSPPHFYRSISVTEHPSFPSPHRVISSILLPFAQTQSRGPARRGGGGGGGAPHPAPGRAGQTALLGAGKWLLSAPGRPASRRERRQGSALGRGASRRPRAGLPPRGRAFRPGRRPPALPPASACPPPPPRPRRPVRTFLML